MNTEDNLRANPGDKSIHASLMGENPSNYESISAGHMAIILLILVAIILVAISTIRLIA